MQINGYELNYSEEQLAEMVNHKMQPFELIDENFAGYQALGDDDKKALQHLMAAGRIMNEVSLEQDHPQNREMKKALQEAAPDSNQAALTLRIFNSFNGVEGLNGVDPEPISLFKGIHGYKGRNFYPTDLSVEEFHRIIKQMLQNGKTDEVRKILSARTMVRRKGEELVAIDYTEYFAKEFSAIANELEVAAHYATNALFKDYLGWQAQALLQNNEDMDMLADKHWAQMQDTDLEFTIGRENYDDEMSATITENKELMDLLAHHKIEVVSKDMLGVRVGIINKPGTELLLKFKEHMAQLAKVMPYADQYMQSVSASDEIKQTMVDVDLSGLFGDYAQCRGSITLAQNLPNNDKLSVKTGGGRRNVYHRQVRLSNDRERTHKILDALVHPDFHKYFDLDAEHIFVIGHENGHSLGPDSSYQSSLGLYRNIIEESKADIVSIALMPEYVKAGIIDEETLKKIYVTWVIRMTLKSRPVMAGIPHRIADLIHFNFLLEHGAISFAQDKKLSVDFNKMNDVMHKILDKTIALQLSKSPAQAKAHIEQYTSWGDLHQHIAEVYQKIGIKPYKDIRMHF